MTFNEKLEFATHIQIAAYPGPIQKQGFKIVRKEWFDEIVWVQGHHTKISISFLDLENSAGVKLLWISGTKK